MQALIPLIGGIIAIIVAFLSRNMKDSLVATGKSAEGIVFDTITDSGPDGMTWPIIRFTTEKQEWITEKANITTPDLLKQGKTVTVFYNPEDPKEFIVQSKYSANMWLFFAVIGLGFVAYGAYRLFVFYHSDAT